MRNKVLLILLVGFMVACGKKAHKVDPLYLGTWYGVDTKYRYTLVVKDDDRGEWNKTELGTFVGGSSTTANGHVRVSGKNLRIGIKKLSLDQGPTQNQNVYTIILDGVTYLKY
jgi:hypothetical protein